MMHLHIYIFETGPRSLIILDHLALFFNPAPCALLTRSTHFARDDDRDADDTFGQAMMTSTAAAAAAAAAADPRRPARARRRSASCGCGRIKMCRLIRTRMVTTRAMGQADATGFALTFGTAGLRAEMGPGPDRINSNTIQLAAQGLAEYLIERGEEEDKEDETTTTVVLGYDGRHLSQQLADIVRRVLGSRGIACVKFCKPIPTPLVAYAVARFGYAGGIVITGSGGGRRVQ